MDFDPDVFERVEELEKKFRRLENIIQFHKLHDIPVKYCKAFPKEDEHPYFGSELKFHVIGNNGIDSPFSHIKSVPPKKELNASKKRMRENLRNYKKKST